VKCRHCEAELASKFLDLGFAPPSNAYLKAGDLNRPEKYYPLRVLVCDRCWLVQTEDYADAGELFNSEYAYFSSTSAGWLSHAKHYAQDMISRLALGKESMVIEIAANDGYLLKNFVAAGIPCLGIEPTASTAAAAEALGIPVLREFFGEALGRRLAGEGSRAELIVGNNVYAHVPDINDFTRGLAAVLKPGGTITLEFPHVMRLIQQAQFDTVYHEHFSYLSLFTVARIFHGCGLRVYDVEELPTHGGSLRIYGCLAGDVREENDRVKMLLAGEAQFGLQDAAIYAGFQDIANKVKDNLLQFLIAEKGKGKKIVGYGAAAKGNTLLNYAGVKPDLLPYICDAAPSKQGKFMPGSHIPIVAPNVLSGGNADTLLILPWNICQEIASQLATLLQPGTEIWVGVPNIRRIA
jgi:SAM-dependent methyltransferase